MTRIQLEVGGVGRCPACGKPGYDAGEERIVFDEIVDDRDSIMAREAGIYTCTWQPEVAGLKRADELIELLDAGLRDLKSQSDHFKKFNGYYQFCAFVSRYIKACHENPWAKVLVNREHE